MDSEKNAAGGYKSLFRRHANLTVRYMRTFVLWAAAGLAIGALGGLIGIHVEVNPFTAMAVGFLGLPGAALVIALQLLI